MMRQRLHPAVCNQCEPTDTPNIVNIGPIQIFAVKTPQYPIANIADVPINNDDPIANPGCNDREIKM